MPDRKRNAAMVRLVDIPYFIHWCAALWTLVPSVVVTLLVPLVEVVRGAPVALPMGAYMWTYLAGLLVCGYGILVRRRWFRVVEREVRVSGLDARFDGLRVAHLSDLHVGTLTPKSWAMAWVRAANGRAPDLAVVTGDMVTSGTAYHEDIAEAVSWCRSSARAACASCATRVRSSSGREAGCGWPPSTTPGRGATTSSEPCADGQRAPPRCCSRTIPSASTRRRTRAQSSS
jgi:hypothetical protein